MNVEELRAALETAKKELAQLPLNERPAAEAEILAGEKRLKDLMEANPGSPAAPASHKETDQEELFRLRNEKRETELRTQLGALAESVAAGAKAKAQEAEAKEADLLSTLLNEALAKVGLTRDGGLTGAVRQVLAETRTGFKNRVEEVSEHAQTSYADGRAPAFNRGRPGERADFGSFILAIGRECIGVGTKSEIGQVQRAAGMKAYFSLTEGAGATSAVTGPGGGYLVPPQFNTDLIEGIYPYLVLRSAGVQVIPMKSNQYNQPRLSSQMTATYVGETQPIPTSVEGFTQFNLTAHKLTGLVPMSRELVADSDPSVEMVVREDMSKQLGVAEDKAFLLGTGPSFNQPSGILTAASGATILAAVSTNAGDAITYENIVDIRTTLNKTNIPLINRIWITTPDLLGTIAKIKNPTSGNYVFVDNAYSVPQSVVNPGIPTSAMKPSGTLLGIPVYTSTQLGTPFAGNGTTVTSTLALAELSQLRIGQRGDIELAAFDQATFVDGAGALNSAVQDDMIVFRALMRHDIALRHTGAVVVRPLFVV